MEVGPPSLANAFFHGVGRVFTPSTVGQVGMPIMAPLPLK
jgi:hypothetical protein